MDASDVEDRLVVVDHAVWTWRQLWHVRDESFLPDNMCTSVISHQTYPYGIDIAVGNLKLFDQNG